MRFLLQVKSHQSRHFAALVLLAGLLVTLAACNGGSRAGRRNETDLAAYAPKPSPRWQEVQLASLQVPVPEIADAEFVEDDELCMTCHSAYVQTFQHNVHHGQSCEKCHGPASRHLQSRGQDPTSILSFKKLNAPERSELCLKCHEQNACTPGAQWRTSPHAHHGVACTDCHTSHYNVTPGTPPTQLASADGQPLQRLVDFVRQDPPADQETLRAESNNLGAITPQVCYRCHSSMLQQSEIAHPHQIGGANGFDCTTCHNPHGKIREESRTQLCLQCHNMQAPTMAWHSSSHARFGVGCTDCHNPHPNQNLPQVVNIQHTHISRPKRMPMSVDEPGVCYKCHADIYAKTSMPSHHPIKEGKMVCSDCHDGHGQSLGNLKEPTINMVCYRCHAEKQGPFVYEHPPVTENCDYCHEPHGTVANQLLRQPTTFLCLRCHSGHRTGPTFNPHTAAGLVDVGTNPNLQRSFYSDCTQCHSQIHGSDLPSPHLPHAFMR